LGMEKNEPTALRINTCEREKARKQLKSRESPTRKKLKYERITSYNEVEINLL